MGFLDKAKVLAEQAQAKLDDVQTQFNERQKSDEPAPSGPGYDKHGRPLATEQAETPAAEPPPATEPQAAEPQAATPPEPEPEHAATGPEAAEPPAGKPGAPKAAPGSGSGLSSGDPLAG